MARLRNRIAWAIATWALTCIATRDYRDFITAVSHLGLKEFDRLFWEANPKEGSDHANDAADV